MFIGTLFRRYPLEIILVILFVGLCFAAPGFFTVNNQLNVLRNITMDGRPHRRLGRHR